jgi:hypothetical protein
MMRDTIYTWPSIKKFIKSLSKSKAELTKNPELIGFILSKNLREKANEFKRKKHLTKACCINHCVVWTV